MVNSVLHKVSYSAAIALIASLASTSQAGIVTSGPSLPPINAEYVDSSVEYVGVGFSIVLANLVLGNFANIVETKVGPDEFQSFHAILDGDGDVNGSGPSAFALSGPVQMLAHNKADITTGTFDIEIVDLSLIGDVGAIPIIVRESPTVPSTGQTTIVDIGGGQFAIESFFDLFTEISVDGGATWVPSTEGSRYALQAIPLPAGLPLLMSALVSLISICSRRHAAQSTARK